MKPYLSSDLKVMNRQNVYNLFCETEQISKSEIARLTGISPPTVIKIINFFNDKGLIKEMGEGSSALGRKPQMICLNADRFFAVGVILEGDFLKTGIVNLLGEVKAIRKVRVKESFFDLISVTLPVIIENLMADLSINIKNLLGIGIGIPGVYDVEHQRISMAPLIGITNPTDISTLRDNIKNRFGIPIAIENDLNMEVLGEYKSLKLGEKKDLVYLSLGTGFGAGVILNGELRRGHNYMCGEIGYMTFLDDYIANVENAGWLESKINLNVMEKKFHITTSNNDDPKIIDLAAEYVSIPIALCINNIVTCLDCDNVSVGGEIFDIIGDKLFLLIEDKVKKLCLNNFHLFRQTSVDPGIIGAANVVTNTSLNKIWTD